MALLRFISLSVGSLMLFQGAYTEEVPAADGATAPTALAISYSECVTTMNAARQQVSLPIFGTPSTPAFKEGNNTDAATSICTWLQAGSGQSLSAVGISANATAAYQQQATQNCAEALTSWKAGFSAYSTYTKKNPPPAFTGTSTSQLGTAPYNTVSAVNFAALYNAKANATAECAFVSCPQTQGAKAVSEAATPVTYTNSTVCITYPAALTDNVAPWTKDQWEKIVSFFSSSSSASAAVPTLLALAAAAVGVVLM